ncbi:MAG TPA: nitrate- and nitrite sensing domain-containing protein [Streptosporangiaceae bacterium]|nr:nitrate- and nitrite sensing domain-containing protein [Streptosporangiaceae bacterium]
MPGAAKRDADATASKGAASQVPVALPPGTRGTERPATRTRRSSSRRSRFALENWRVRWRLVAVIAVPTLTAAFLGAFTIYGDVNTWVATGRVQHLAQLNASVVKLTQALEDERDLSAGYAANRPGSAAIAGRLTAAQAATDSAVTLVETQAAGVTTGAGYQSTTVQNFDALLNSLSDLGAIRYAVAHTLFPASQVIRVYTGNIIQVANTFSASVGSGANDADLEANVNTLGALLRVENQMSVQRAILYAALSSPQLALAPEDLANLQQAYEQQLAEEADFDAQATTAEGQNYSNTVAGSQVDLASSEEQLAISMATASASAPLTGHNSGLNAAAWYGNQTYTITQTRAVADQLVTAITDRAETLRSQATRDLIVTSLVTLLLLLLVLLVSTVVARSLIRPLRKLRTDALDVAGHRLPEMVRKLSQSEGADEGVDIEPIGVTSTDEIGEVARAFDQVHREAVRLAADEAMLRGNLNAMFINLSRRSQSLIERQLSLIDSLEQSEQDPGRLSSLFRLDHLATRMRRNSENLLVLAGHEVTRRWSQPVPLVDVLRAAISEIEQYERVVLNVQPGIVVVGQAVNDVVHLVAEIVENATTFSPEDTQVYVSGQPLSSGGVLLDITDNGVGISDQEMSHANWRLDNPPVVDVAVSRRMGLFVVGRLAARHGVRVRLRHAQAGGLTALIWLPDTVAAPEVAPPLGRLRRFEADDFGPAPSLSAPTVAAGTGAQATTAARIPRFSPLSPGASASPPAGTPAAGAAAPGSGQPPGSGQEEPAELPVRGGNGSTASPANGLDPKTDQGADPQTPSAPAAQGGQGGPPSAAGPGPSKLPAFGGHGPQAPPLAQSQIGSQNVHGGDGPSAADVASPANGQATDGAADQGKVAVPPSAPQDQRLPIFDSLESDWFRRSGKTHSTTRSQGAQGAQGGQDGQAAQPSAPSWTSPADEGWRAAEVVAAPAAGETTQAGLPRRVPRANLVPGSVGGSEAEAEAPARSADAVRTRMASFQRGVREGRAAAPQIEEP